MKTKVKKIIIGFVIIVAMVVAFTFILWNNYYRSIWEPLILISESKEANEQMDYELVKDNCSYYLYRPEVFKYSGNLQVSMFKPFDPNNAETQLSFGIIIWPQKDGTFKWGVMIHELVGYNNYVEICSAYFNPNNMKILSNIGNKEKEIFQHNQEAIKKLVQNACDFWEINNK
ncbi:MAG: hypothetical protein RR012_03095 [Oscillospiraceae bacterium]